MHKTMNINGIEHPIGDLYQASNAYWLATAWGLGTEVLLFAIFYMKRHPESTVAEALEEGLYIWVT